MKIKSGILTLTFLLFTIQTIGQNRIVINIPSADSESEYIWRTIQDIKFFEKMNYQVNLPKGSLIEDLKHKSKLDKLTDNDFEELKTYVKNHVYNAVDYQKGYEKIKKEIYLINKMINQISQSVFNWNFKEFKTYNVSLTLYGSGGSYNPDEGIITVFTTTDGGFKNYDNPSCTIIHEVTHIGLEEEIISKYNVPHALKERIVDTFVSLNFSQFIPEYKVQNMGETRIDQYLKTTDDLKKLDEIVELILK